VPFTSAVSAGSGTLLGNTALPAVQYNLGVAAYMQQTSTLTPLPSFSAAIPYLPADIDAVVPSPEYSKDKDGWLWGSHPDFSSDRMQAIKDAVRKHKKAFAYQVTDLPGYHGKIPPFSIELTTSQPVYTPPRRFSPLEVDVIDKKCEELRDADLIEPAPHTDGFASPPVVAAKKDENGEWTDHRFCVDFRKLNASTKPDRYGLHRIDDLFAGVGDAVIFSKIDLRAGFHQIPIDPASRSATSFWWKNQLWRYKRMPFGLRNAPSVFQRIVDHELTAAGCDAFARGYIDDILIWSKTPEEHAQHLEQVLHALHQCGLRAHPDKSIFGTACLEYLGHNLSAKGLSPCEVKVKAIAQLKSPGNVSELRSVLGFLNYYRVYLPCFSQLAEPMVRLLSKAAKWLWGGEQEASFASLKTELTKPGRALCRFDPSKPVRLYTDWSKQGISAIMHQVSPD